MTEQKNGNHGTSEKIEPVGPRDPGKTAITESLYAPFRSELFQIVFGVFILIVVVAYIYSFSFILETKSMVSMVIFVIALYIFEIIDPTLNR